MTAPDTISDPEVADDAQRDEPWTVVVWDDPVNLMDYVVFVFQEVLGFPAAKASKLMFQVHNSGKAVVFSGLREPAEFTATRLASYGLWATMER